MLKIIAFLTAAKPMFVRILATAGIAAIGAAVDYGILDQAIGQNIIAILQWLS